MLDFLDILPKTEFGDSAIINLRFCQPNANIKLKSYKVYFAGRCPALCSYELFISLSVLRRSAAITAILCPSIRALWQTCGGVATSWSQLTFYSGFPGCLPDVFFPLSDFYSSPLFKKFYLIVKKIYNFYGEN